MDKKEYINDIKIASDKVFITHDNCTWEYRNELYWKFYHLHFLNNKLTEEFSEVIVAHRDLIREYEKQGIFIDKHIKDKSVLIKIKELKCDLKDKIIDLASVCTMMIDSIERG